MQPRVNVTQAVKQQDAIVTLKARLESTKLFTAYAVKAADAVPEKAETLKQIVLLLDQVTALAQTL